MTADLMLTPNEVISLLIFLGLAPGGGGDGRGVVEEFMNSPLHTFFRHESERLVQNGQPPLSDEEIEELVELSKSPSAMGKIAEFFEDRSKKSPPSDAAHLEGLAVDLL